MNDLPEYDGMKRRGTRYEVRVSVPPDVAAALHEEAVRRDVGPGVVARGWMREYRVGVETGPMARARAPAVHSLRPKTIIIDDPMGDRLAASKRICAALLALPGVIQVQSWRCDGVARVVAEVDPAKDGAGLRDDIRSIARATMAGEAYDLIIHDGSDPVSSDVDDINDPFLLSQPTGRQS